MISLIRSAVERGVTFFDTAFRLKGTNPIPSSSSVGNTGYGDDAAADAQQRV